MKQSLVIVWFGLLSLPPLQAEELVPGLWTGWYETRLDGEFQARFEVPVTKQDQEKSTMTMILPEVDEARYPLEKISLENGALVFEIKTGTLRKNCQTRFVAGKGYQGYCRRDGADASVVATRIQLTPPQQKTAVPAVGRKD